VSATLLPTQSECLRGSRLSPARLVKSLPKVCLSERVGGFVSRDFQEGYILGVLRENIDGFRKINEIQAALAQVMEDACPLLAPFVIFTAKYSN
jgi:hypothetical protein